MRHGNESKVKVSPDFHETIYLLDVNYLLMCYDLCQVAWVTRSGKTELAEPIAVRPTSETGLNHSLRSKLPVEMQMKIHVACSIFKGI